MALPLTDDFEKLIIDKIPLIDVRAPIEFEKGAFPTAYNLPLMNNEERKKVGICYKQNGNAAALKLGHELVSDTIKEARIQAWINLIQKNPDAVLYCFRGGQRSRISQQWLHDAGYPITRIKGGYKAFRNYLLNAFDTMQDRFTPILLGGRTGSGKTLLLHKINHMIDLEGVAKHRGSAFGGHIQPQPAQIDFENSLAFALIQKLHLGCKYLIFEDEGKNVGRRYLPQPFFETIAHSGLVILETPLDERIEITFNEYVKDAQNRYQKFYGKEEGIQQWARTIQSSIDRIQRRLGGKRHKEITELFEIACKKQQIDHDLSKHKQWIQPLLKDYYDPMYDYQIKKRENKIIFKGDKDAVYAYLEEFNTLM